MNTEAMVEINSALKQLESARNKLSVSASKATMLLSMAADALGDESRQGNAKLEQIIREFLEESE